MTREIRKQGLKDAWEEYIEKAAFKINKSWELMAWKSYWPLFKNDFEVYVKKGNFVFYPKQSVTNFVIGLSVFINKKAKLTILS